MSYALLFGTGVEKDIRRLPRHVQLKVDRLIQGLSANPRPANCVKLTGQSRMFRLRVGDWRIVYEVHDSRHQVEIHIVAHRREVYRGF